MISCKQMTAAAAWFDGGLIQQSSIGGFGQLRQFTYFIPRND